MVSKEQLHRLVEELPEGELHAARRYLEYLRNVGRDPVLQAFMGAPEDDEALTEHEERAIQEAEEEISRGEGLPWGEVRMHSLRPDEKAGWCRGG